jgi:hypothetical protein
VKHLALLLVLPLYGFTAFGQQLIPHPFGYIGPELMGGGYRQIAGVAGAGFRIDSPHFLFDASALYDNARKVNDGTGLNPHGHDRGLQSMSYYRFTSGWFLGAGVGWKKLSTTNYSKSSVRPRFGGGKDFVSKRCAGEDCITDFSMRLGTDYLIPGTDWQNGLHGPQINIYVPSPSEKGHIFYRETIGIYRFHQTLTDRTNLQMTRAQMGRRYWTGFSEFTIMYRF